MLAICLSSCAEKTYEGRPLKISLNVWPGYAHAFIARDKEYFDKYGVKVELILKKDYSDSLRLFREGETDGAFLAFSDVIILHAEGIASKVVYVADYSDSGDVILGRAELKSLRDLKEKTISFEGFNTFSHLFVLKALEREGVEEYDLRFKIVPAMKVLDALEKGEIDAGHTWEPVTTQAIEKGYKILGKAGDLPGIITDVLIFSERAVKERSEEIQGVVKSLLKARDFVYAGKEEALAIMARAEGMDPEEMAEGIRGTHQLDAKENREAIASTLPRMGSQISRFYMERGQLPKKPDFDEILDGRFVEKILARKEGRE